MARYQLILAYDGTDFVGSQRQARSRTVQGELERALRKIGWEGRSVLLAGRTDTGVHAAGQVAACDFDWGHTPDELREALNANLPADMAVREARLAADGFHPRFDATARRYRYRLFSQQVRDPLRERFAWRVWPPVDATALPGLAELWPGEHDFAAFGTPPRPGGSSVRRVLSADWRPVGDEWWFEVQADAFLYRMVRRLVFVQVAAAQGRTSRAALARAIERKADLLAGLAPACGLTLLDVTYPPEAMARTGIE